MRNKPNNACVSTPTTRTCSGNLWFDTVRSDYWVSEKDGLAATDLFVRSAQDFEPELIWAYFPEAAQFLLSHG
jgi:hypothetical protein